jgi:hypothetical protein
MTSNFRDAKETDLNERNDVCSQPIAQNSLENKFQSDNSH